MKKIAHFCCFVLMTLFFSPCAFGQIYTVLKHFGLTTNVSGASPNAPLIMGPDGTLYGTTSSGQGNLLGTVFKVNSDGTGFKAIKWFTNSIEGSYPQGNLVLSGNTLYGTTLDGGSFGGSSGYGTVFKINTDGTGFAVLKNFDSTNGSNPQAGLVLSGNTLYGTTSSGGSSNYGTVFALSTDGTGYKVLKSFTGLDGRLPQANLLLTGSTLYGTTGTGGNSNLGTVFTLNTDGSGFTVLKSFGGYEGRQPRGLLLSGNTLYGITRLGGANYGVGTGNASLGYGTVFSLNTDGSSFSVLYEFSGYDGWLPYGVLVLAGNALYGVTQNGGSTMGGVNMGDGVVFTLNTDGSGFTTLYNFSGADGNFPSGGLLLSSNALYGATSGGGASGSGEIFSINTDGSGFSVLTNFMAVDGMNPFSSLTYYQGMLYGTTSSGGISNLGTVFRMSTDGTGFTNIFNFTRFTGHRVIAPLVCSGDVLYGAAQEEGVTLASSYGTVFKLNTDGTGFAVLKSFTNNAGQEPSGLIVSGDAIYGTTLTGGTPSGGTIFKMNTDGSGFTVMLNLGGTNGAPGQGMVLSGNTLYGATFGGGSANWGAFYSLNTDGTGFKIIQSAPYGYPLESPLLLSNGALYGVSGTTGLVAYRLNTDGTGFTTLCNYPTSGGSLPYGVSGIIPGLVLSGNTLYGVDDLSGTSKMGAIYQVNTNGTGFAVLRSFAGPDGATPLAAMVVSGNTLYGTTAEGGMFGGGVVFALEMPPTLTATVLGRQLLLNCIATPGRSYQVQYTSSLNPGRWINLGSPIVASTNALTVSDSLDAVQQRFYRVMMQ